MPIPKRRQGETKKAFISRCMGDGVMKREYPNNDQRLAVCNGQLKAQSMGFVLSTLSSYSTRREMHEGREHIVAPVVIFVEGVHVGSGGRVLYKSEELGKFPSSWNGIPLPVFHPEEDGVPVSANTPELVQEQSVGRLWNVQYHSDKLQGEIWVDITKAQTLAPEVLEALMERKPLEVSTGLWFDSEEASGTWNGEDYDFIARNMRPDHLALLPGEEGACSVSDGCGVRANMQGGDNVIKLNKEQFQEAIFLIYLNEVGQREKHDLLRSLLDAKDVHSETNPVMHYLMEVFEDYFIFRKEDSSGTTLYKQTYSIGEDKKVKLGEEVKEVREDRRFVEVLSSANSKKEGEMSKTAKECCPEKVNALIANEASKFVKEDRDWLEALTEEQFGKIAGNQAESKDEKKAGEEKEKLIKDNKGLTEKVETLEKQVKDNSDEAKTKKELTFDELLSNAPTETREMIKNGIAVMNAKKGELVKKILAVKSNSFTKEELEGKGQDELGKLAGIAIADYSANLPSDPNTNEEEVLEQPELKFEQK